MNIYFPHTDGFLYALVLLPLLVVGFLFARLRAKKYRASFSLIGAALQLLAVLCLCLALTSPYIEEVSEHLSSLVLLDISDSMDEGSAQQLLSYSGSYQSADHSLEYLPFASDAASFTIKQGEMGSYTQSKRSWSKLDIGNTDLAKALQYGASLGVSNMLLISDGHETRGDAAKLAADLAGRGARVFPLVPRDPRGSREVFRVSHLHAPLVAPAQKSVDVRVSVLNSTGKSQSGILQVLHQGKSIFQKRVRVDAGKEALAVATSDPSQEGIKEITARLIPEDAGLPQSAETTFLSGEEREKVLLVSGEDQEEKLLTQVLKDQVYTVQSVLPQGGKVTLPKLSDFSVVVLNNIELEKLARDAPEELKKYVADGGGFIMLGGNKSFGLGGYKDTVIESILPVDMVPPQTVKKRLSVAVELVLDKSRSMGQGNRIAFAKDAARESIGALKDEDYIGVIGFDAAPFVVVKLAKLKDNRVRALEGVGRLFPTGKTNLLPAIDEARRSLVRVNAGRKHMIILTDGQLPDAGPFYLELVKQLRLVGITVSTVMVGGETDIGLLKSMAELGGGGFYQTVDPRALPKIFLSDLKVSTGERTMKEDEEFIVRPAQGGTVSTEIKSFPPVRGYVQTKAKSEADLELIAYGNERAEPLLASWQYKKGRAVAFTSDASGRWTQYWVSWPKLHEFWGDIIDAARSSDSTMQEHIKFDLRFVVERGSLVMDLTLYNEDAARSLSAAVTLPDGTTREVDFKSVSRGRYMAAIDKAIAGKYEIRALAGERKLTPVAFNISGELFGEQKGKGFNVPFLSALASSTGGAMNPTKEQLSASAVRKVERKELTWLFILAALALLLLETMRREVWRTFPRFRRWRRIAT